MNRSFFVFLFLLLLLSFYKDPLLNRSRVFLVRHFVCCVAVKLRKGYVTSMPTCSGFPVQNKLVRHLGCLVLWQLLNKSVYSGLWYVPNLFQLGIPKKDL